MAAPFRPDVPVAVSLADVPGRLVKRLGTPPLRPGIDPIPPYQEAYGIVRNEDGMSIVHRDPALGFRKFVRATPTPAAGQALVQILYAGATYNVINGITADPVDVLGDKDHHVLGDAAVGQVVLLSPEAEAEGRLAIGQLVLVDPMVFNRQAPTVTLDAQREGHIGGYQGGGDQATLQAFAAFDTGNLVEVPVDMPLPQAATLILNGPTVEHALFCPAQAQPCRGGRAAGPRRQRPHRIHGDRHGDDPGDTGPDLCPRPEGGGPRPQPPSPRGRRLHPAGGASGSLAGGPGRRPGSAGEVAAGGRPPGGVGSGEVPADESHAERRTGPAGGGLPAAAAVPPGQPHRLVFGGVRPVRDVQRVRRQAFAPPRRWARTVRSYGSGRTCWSTTAPTPTRKGSDGLAASAIAEAARLGARVTVLAETQEQQSRLLRREDIAAHFGKTRIQNVEALRGGEGKKKLLWPDHMPDVDEGRFAPEREAHRSWPGRDAQTRFATETVSVVKEALGPYNTNRSGSWDAIWDSGRRDHLALNMALLTEQTGRVVYGETSSRQTLTYHLAQGWMLQRTILVPANPEELGDERDGPGEDRPDGRLPHVRAARGAELPGQDRPGDLPPPWAGPGPRPGPDPGRVQRSAGRPGPRFDRLPDGDRPRRRPLRARPAAGPGGSDRRGTLVDAAPVPPPGPGRVDRHGGVQDQPPQGSNTLRNSDLHWFRGDAVKQLRFLFHRIREEASARAVVLTAEGTRAFVPGQNSDELAVLTDEQITELAAHRPGDDEPDRGLQDPRRPEPERPGPGRRERSSSPPPTTWSPRGSSGSTWASPRRTST